MIFKFNGMTIDRNVIQLTEEDKNLIKECNGYVYVSGCIYLIHPSKVLFWDCSNTVKAKEYLDSEGIREHE